MKDNKGISLVEILVSIAIMGIVSSMIATLLVGGTRFFRNQSNVIDLQNDSQLIENYITTSILEGSEFVVTNAYDAGGKSVKMFETGNSKYVFVPSGTDADKKGLYVLNKDDDVAATVFGAGSKGYLLSKYVTDFVIHEENVLSDGGTDPDDDSKKAQKMFLIVEYSLAHDNGEAEQSFDVSPRNTGVTFERK